MPFHTQQDLRSKRCHFCTHKGYQSKQAYQPDSRDIMEERWVHLYSPCMGQSTVSGLCSSGLVQKWEAGRVKQGCHHRAPDLHVRLQLRDPCLPPSASLGGFSTHRALKGSPSQRLVMLPQDTGQVAGPGACCLTVYVSSTSWQSHTKTALSRFLVDA